MTVRSQKSEDDRNIPPVSAPLEGVSAQRYVSVDPESEEGPGIPPKSGALERHFLAGTIEDLFNMIHR